MLCAPVKEEFNYTVNYSSECRDIDSLGGYIIRLRGYNLRRRHGHTKGS